VSTPDTESSALKSAARAEARARRRAASAPDPRALADQALVALQGIPGPRRVTCYASYGTEPSTIQLREALGAAGYEVLLPRVAGDDIDWVVDDGSAETSSMGIAEPTGPAVDLLPVAAMLVPALAVTAQGDRLGKGGGYYDRVIAALGEQRPVIAALVDDADVVATVPLEAHDGRVDLIITPTRIIDCVTR